MTTLDQPSSSTPVNPRRGRFAATVTILSVILAMNLLLTAAALFERSGLWAMFIITGNRSLAHVANLLLGLLSLCLLPAVWRRSGFRVAALHLVLTILLATLAPRAIELACINFGRYSW